VPGAFATACVPGTIPGQDVLAQENSGYDPNKPRFNSTAFENPRQLFANPTYYGSGSRYTNIRTIPFRNQDFSVYKNVLLWPEQNLNVQLRFEAFNVFNWHIFQGWITDVANPRFGAWTGGVTPPRTLQLGAKVTF
jgi:hypothetical protein